jgi:hypothetical protein
VPPAEEEDEPGIVAIAELTVDSKTESVPVETSTAIQVGWSQQDPATEDVHASDHAGQCGLLPMLAHAFIAVTAAERAHDTITRALIPST